MKEFMANFDKNADGKIEMAEVRAAVLGASLALVARHNLTV